ncbi:MAG: signal peptidase I [Phototrophicales bacterium]|nr:MAG: signal peptidase I [Phototrophicales bacterium]
MEAITPAPIVEDMPKLPRPRIGQFRAVKEVISTLLFLIAVFTLLQLALPRSEVHGRSMEPTFVEGQRLIISRINYMLGDPQRGDIVVFNSPQARDDDPSLIKRVIGLPGELVEIRDREVYINGERLDEPYIKEPCTRQCRDRQWQLANDEYFVMGDNRNVSNDSRAFGPIKHSAIIGEALFRYWPLNAIGFIHRVNAD